MWRANHNTTQNLVSGMGSKCIFGCAAALVLIAGSQVRAATPVYADNSGGGCNGLAPCFATIQLAVNAASDPDLRAPAPAGRPTGRRLPLRRWDAHDDAPHVDGLEMGKTQKRKARIIASKQLLVLNNSLSLTGERAGVRVLPSNEYDAM